MCALVESNHIGASFFLHAIIFQVYHSCTRCAIYTAENNHITSTSTVVCKTLLRGFSSHTYSRLFSGLTNSLFALHPHRIVHFLTLGLLQHAVLVNVGGLEPPLTEPKSVVLPLHHTSFCPTAVRLINLNISMKE